MIVEYIKVKYVIQTSRKKNYLSLFLAITANELYTCTWLLVKASTPIVKPTPTSILIVTPTSRILIIVFIVADPSLLADVLTCWKPG